MPISFVPPITRECENIDKYSRYDNASFVKKEIQARVQHLSAAVCYLGDITLRTVKGLGLGTYAVITGLKSQDRVQNASNNYQYANRLISIPFAHLLKAVNPNANVGLAERGFFTANFITPLMRNAAERANLYKDSNSFNKQVVTRTNYALIAIACVITRVVDFSMGAAAAVFALLTAGLIPKLNHFAYSNLTGSGLISDLANLGLNIINPYNSPRENRTVWEIYPQRGI